MTKIKCGWSACIYNTATNVKQIGICEKDEVVLNFNKTAETIYDIDAMVCDSFKWDKDKFWR